MSVFLFYPIKKGFQWEAFLESLDKSFIEQRSFLYQLNHKIDLI